MVQTDYTMNKAKIELCRKHYEQLSPEAKNRKTAKHLRAAVEISERLIRENSALEHENREFRLNAEDRHVVKAKPQRNCPDLTCYTNMNVDNLTYEECRALSARCQDRMDSIDADELAKIDVTPEEFHTLETRGRVAAVKQLKARTNCRLRIAIMAIKAKEGSFV
jgi:hypothetical protein